MLETVGAFFIGLGAMLVVGSWGFWFLVIAASLAIITALEYEKGWGATLTLLSTVGVVILCNGGFRSALSYASEHLVTFLLLAAGYLLTGLVWMIVKWWFFTRNFADKYEAARTSFLRSHKLAPDAAVPVKLKNDLARHIKEKLSRDYGDDYDSRYKVRFDSDGYLVPLEPLDHSATLAMWAGHWPFSALWTLLNDPVKQAFRFCIARMTGLLRAISASNFRTAQRDRITSDEVEELNPPSSDGPKGKNRGGVTIEE